MMFASCSPLDMQGAAHTMMTSDIAIKCQLKGSCLRDIDMKRLRNSFKKFHGRYPDHLGIPNVSVGHSWDSFPSVACFKWIVVF